MQHLLTNVWHSALIVVPVKVETGFVLLECAKLKEVPRQILIQLDWYPYKKANWTRTGTLRRMQGKNRGKTAV